MPPARLTGARRSERAPAYGARTLYLPDTTTALPAVRRSAARRRLPGREDERIRPRAANQESMRGRQGRF
ncbi:hypothetical protein F7R21_29105 [Burkholderia latens]|uniref:Uncharacterized protein n=1 Tax=Burkholderia latens TaxID=488446 RepID=A0A6H9SJG9_9BURK|nr:hypothetical protein F7R21_29105 [Burkholderia latens]